MNTLILLAIGLLSLLQMGPQKKDVPETAVLEAARRGEHVEELGSFQAGPEAAAVQAMAPPDDDSDKWWVTVVTAGAASSDKAKAASKLLIDDIHQLKFREWVKPDDPANSWAHYQERREDDPLQKDWIDPIRQRLAAVGLPAVVIQPPASGKYGKNSTIVAVIGSYNGNPEQFCQLIQQRVKAYIEKNAVAGTIVANEYPSGHSQVASGGNYHPPFDLPEPIAHPEAKFLKPKNLTFEEIRKKYPAIPPDEAAEYADKGITAEELEAAEKQRAEVDSKPANPQPPATVPEKVQPGEQEPVNATPMLILVAVILILIPQWLPLIQSWNDKRKNTKPST